MVRVPAAPTEWRGWVAERRSEVAATVIVSGAAIVLLTIRIGRSFGYDEGFTYHFFINGGSVRRALTTQVVFNNHPMFSATQAAAWRLGLTGETAQRLGPVFAATITVGAVAWLVARRAGVLGGVAAGVTLLLNEMFLGQARQLRGYALATCAVLLAAIWIRHSWHDRHRRWLVAQGVAMVVAVTTHAMTVLVLASIAAAALVLRRVERRHLLTWGLAAAAALAIAAPVLDDARANAEARGNRYFASFPRTLAESLTSELWLVAGVLVVLAGIGVWELVAGSRERQLAAAAGIGVFLLGVVVLWQIVRPFDLYPRFFVSVVPFVAILVGLGAAALPRRSGVIAILLVVVALGPGVRDLIGQTPTLRDAAAIADRARAEDEIVCGIHAEPLQVYTPPMPLLSGVDGFGDCRVVIAVLGLSGPARAAASEHYSGTRSIGGGVTVWADESLLQRIVDDPS